jgi:hypothetical protein
MRKLVLAAADSRGTRHLVLAGGGTRHRISVSGSNTLSGLAPRRWLPNLALTKCCITKLTSLCSRRRHRLEPANFDMARSPSPRGAGAIAPERHLSRIALARSARSRLDKDLPPADHGPRASSLAKFRTPAPVMEVLCCFGTDQLSRLASSLPGRRQADRF